LRVVHRRGATDATVASVGKAYEGGSGSSVGTPARTVGRVTTLVGGRRRGSAIARRTGGRTAVPTSRTLVTAARVSPTTQTRGSWAATVAVCPRARFFSFFFLQQR